MSSGPCELVLFRPRGWAGAARRIEFLVDGVPVGRVWPGGRIAIKVQPGSRAVDARFGANGVSDTLFVEVGVKSPASVGVVFVDPKTVRPHRTADPSKRRMLNVRVAPKGSMSQVAMPRLVETIGGSRKQQAIWVVAWLLCLVGTFVVRPFDSLAGTIVGLVGAVIIIAMFFRRMKYRDPSSRKGPAR